MRSGECKWIVTHLCHCAGSSAAADSATRVPLHIGRRHRFQPLEAGGTHARFRCCTGTYATMNKLTVMNDSWAQPSLEFSAYERVKLG
jgi:hypothetical protein